MTRARFLVALLLPFLVGCAAWERRYWRNYLEDRPGRTVQMTSVLAPGAGGGELVLNTGSLRMDRAEVAVLDGAEVWWPEGWEPVAKELSVVLGEALENTWRELGFRPMLEASWCLTPVPDPELRVRLDVVERSGSMTVPFFFREGDDAPRVLLRNRVGLMVFTHELVEATLVFPRRQPTVLPDGEMHYLFLRRAGDNDTRWMRDGYATYAGVQAVRHLEELVAERWPEVEFVPGSAQYDGLWRLSVVGEDLFAWSNNDTEDERDPELYYAASYGLFELLRERYGEQVLATFLARIPQLEFPDGSALEALLSEVVGEDVRGLAAGFEFDLGLGWEGPEGGLFDDGLALVDVAPGSPAEGAGFETGDGLLAIDGLPRGGVLDVEMAVLCAREEGRSVRVTVRRDGTALVIEVPAARP